MINVFWSLQISSFISDLFTLNLKVCYCPGILLYNWKTLPVLIYWWMNKFSKISFAIITIMYSKKSMCPLWSSSKMLKIDSDRFLAWFPYRSLETSMNNFLLLSQCQNGDIMKLIFRKAFWPIHRETSK